PHCLSALSASYRTDPAPSSTLFPYTTLFRSPVLDGADDLQEDRLRVQSGVERPGHHVGGRVLVRREGGLPELLGPLPGACVTGGGGQTGADAVGGPVTARG